MPITGYERLLSVLKEKANHINDESLAKAYDTLLSIIRKINGLIVTPTYIAALSMALMVTALEDIYVTNYKYYITSKQIRLFTSLIFSAGDDVLALAPRRACPKLRSCA